MILQPRVRVGDTLRSAIWLKGTETPELIAFHKAQVEQTIAEANERARAVTSPVRWSELRPGDPHVPPVPDHIAGPAVRLLVAEADVLNVLNVLASESRFLAELEPSDLRRLRKITRDAHKRWWLENMKGRPWPKPSDRQCDTLINDLGPETAIAALERGHATLH